MLFRLLRCRQMQGLNQSNFGYLMPGDTAVVHVQIMVIVANKPMDGVVNGLFRVR